MQLPEQNVKVLIDLLPNLHVLVMLVSMMIIPMPIVMIVILVVLLVQLQPFVKIVTLVII